VAGPRHGDVADCMRCTQAAYHYAIRRVKRDEELIVRDRIATSILSDDGRIFWAEIKRIIRSSKAKLLTVLQILRVSLNCSLVNIKNYIRVCLMIRVSCRILIMA